jgi:hypothetical protein
MKPVEMILFGLLAVMTAYVLVSFPLDSLASFNPLEWLADSINGFFDWFFNLFFGWMF